MDITTYLISEFCLIDDWLKDKRIRQRGPQPRLSDSEVLTIQVVGEFLGIDYDKELYTHFCRHFGDWFPALREVDRTTFARRAANLWVMKVELSRFSEQVRAFQSRSAVLPGQTVVRFLRGWRRLDMTKLPNKPFMDCERMCASVGRE